MRQAALTVVHVSKSNSIAIITSNLANKNQSKGETADPHYRCKTPATQPTQLNALLTPIHLQKQLLVVVDSTTSEHTVRNHHILRLTP
jgi:flagellar basal body rod protein FlgC